MSLAIDVDDVTRVLLADGWHQVAEQSFLLDGYDFTEHGHTDHPVVVHECGSGGVCSTGFQFKDADTGMVISGPLTTVLAVEHE